MKREKVLHYTFLHLPQYYKPEASARRYIAMDDNAGEAKQEKYELMSNLLMQSRYLLSTTVEVYP